MAGLGGFLQGLGLAVGNDMIQGQVYDHKQAQIQLEQQQAKQSAMQTQQMAQQQKTQKDIGGFIQSQTALLGADAALPANQAKLYQQAAGRALADGDFSSAKTMTDLSKSATEEAHAQLVQQAQETAVKKEDLANSADTFAASPTREGAMALAKKAIAAGVDPTTIPSNLQSAEGMAWVNQQKLAGMDSKSKAEFVEKAYETKANRDQKWQEHQDTVDLRRATMQQTAAFREQGLEIQRENLALRRDSQADRAQRAPQTVDVGSAKYEFDPDNHNKGERLATDPRYVKLGDKVTATQENNIVAIGGAAAEATRNLTQMARFPTGTTNSPFAHITDHGFLESIEKTGSNALTPEQVQMFQTSSSGLSTELSRVMTLGGGRGANQSVINEVKAQITPTAGDTNIEAAYKLATGAQIVLTRMQSSPRPADASVAKKWDETIDELSKYPNPQQILEASSGKNRQALSKMHGSYNQLLDKMSDTDPLPGKGDPGKGTNAPPLPAGFTLDN